MTTGALREKLRAETAAVHARLHRHPGLSAAASGKIDVARYRMLLMRLYGFHRAFETSLIAYIAQVPARSDLIACDLEALGVSAEIRSAIPLCESLAPVLSEPEALGALYVAEGSALGGMQIARALRAGPSPLEGVGAYRFFSNDGAPRRAWKDLLARLEAICDPQEERAAIVAAVSTFRAFDEWMKDWDAATVPS